MTAMGVIAVGRSSRSASRALMLTMPHGAASLLFSSSSPPGGVVVVVFPATAASFSFSICSREYSIRSRYLAAAAGRNASLSSLPPPPSGGGDSPSKGWRTIAGTGCDSPSVRPSHRVVRG